MIYTQINVNPRGRGGGMRVESEGEGANKSDRVVSWDPQLPALASNILRILTNDTDIYFSFPVVP